MMAGVLVGGVMYLILAGYETLVNAGYQPEIAYFEVLNELKLIVDLIYEGGITYMLESVSETARYGGLTRGSLVVGDEARKVMSRLLKDIKDGSFAREWAGDIEASRKRMNQLMEEIRGHQIERVGKLIRSMMGLKGG
jgi:ketol-acid reductoisomerase